MEDRVHRPVEVDVLRDVVEDEAELPVSGEVRDVAHVARHEVVEADDVVPLGEEAVREVAAEEARGSRDDDAHQARPSPT